MRSDPAVMGGTLVFRGTRVPAQSRFDYLDDGYTLDEFLEMFPSADREDAVEFLRLGGVKPAGIVPNRSNRRVAKPDRLLDSVREILWRDWDPIGVNRSHEARDEYDSYATKISQYLREGVDEYRLTAHLDRLERLSMGISAPDDERNRRVARKLLELVTPPA